MLQEAASAASGRARSRSAPDPLQLGSPGPAPDAVLAAALAGLPPFPEKEWSLFGGALAAAETRKEKLQAYLAAVLALLQVPHDAHRSRSVYHGGDVLS